MDPILDPTSVSQARGSRRVVRVTCCAALVVWPRSRANRFSERTARSAPARGIVATIEACKMFVCNRHGRPQRLQALGKSRTASCRAAEAKQLGQRKTRSAGLGAVE